MTATRTPTMISMDARRRLADGVKTILTVLAIRVCSVMHTRQPAGCEERLQGHHKGEITSPRWVR